MYILPLSHVTKYWMGLRGVAAVLVVAYHLFETYYHGGTSQPINHGYLAVDFFFVLSGFVIGYAYDDRWTVCRHGDLSNGGLSACIRW